MNIHAQQHHSRLESKDIDLLPDSQKTGFALIIVMVVIAILGGIAVHFATNMKVELKLAQNSNYDSDFEVLGLSGVEYARYVLALEGKKNMTYEPFDALHQLWAGGPGSELIPEDEDLMLVSLKNNEIGNGRFSLTITDMERKWNINTANEQMLEQAFILMGVDFSEMPSYTSAILDWMDPDEITRAGGAEMQDYLALEPPYVCKDGPIDDIFELTRIIGITPELFWGPSFDPARHSNVNDPNFDPIGLSGSGFAFSYGLKDIFTAISSGRVNVNTAPAHVLQMIPGIDELTAMEIVSLRSGPDGIPATMDDSAYASPSMLPVLPDVMQLASRFLTVRSLHFMVEVEVYINGITRNYEALLRRESPEKIDILYLRRR